MKIFHLQKKILPPEEKVFYNLFEESAETAFQASNLFLNIICEGLTDEKLVTAKTLKHRSNDLTKQNLVTLNKTFMTPFDREDIQQLATLLNKITKRIIKACFNLRTYRLQEFNDEMKNQAATLIKATEEVKTIVCLLKNKDNCDCIFESNHRAREIETQGDDILYHLVDELFSGKYDALTVIKLRDIYKDIENALDTCFSVTDTVVNIVIKNT